MGQYCIYESRIYLMLYENYNVAIELPSFNKMYIIMFIERDKVVEHVFKFFCTLRILVCQATTMTYKIEIIFN